MFSQPQHIVVGQFSAYSVAGEDFVYYVSISNPLEMVKNWFCSHLFLGLLKFREHSRKSSMEKEVRKTTSHNQNPAWPHLYCGFFFLAAQVAFRYSSSLKEQALTKSNKLT
jgi:hypothetical protein